MVFLKTALARIELQAPYHPQLPYRASKIGGRWMGAEIGWSFSPEREDAVRAICREIWGVDGSVKAWQELVDLEITVHEAVVFRTVFEAYEKPVYLVGREIAAALKSRKAARPGKGVRFVSGKPLCWSNIDTWRVSIPNESVFVLGGVPSCAIERFEQDIGGAGRITRGLTRLIHKAEA